MGIQTHTPRAYPFEPVPGSTLSDYPFSITGEAQTSRSGNGIDALTVISHRTCTTPALASKQTDKARGKRNEIQ
jgi:hypothetical protein